MASGIDVLPRHEPAILLVRRLPQRRREPTLVHGSRGPVPVPAQGRCAEATGPVGQVPDLSSCKFVATSGRVSDTDLRFRETLTRFRSSGPDDIGLSDGLRSVEDPKDGGRIDPSRSWITLLVRYFRAFPP